jgi:hypothetical protein
MVIMFLLGAASASASVLSVYAAVMHVVDGCHRLRPERLLARSSNAGVDGFIHGVAQQVRVCLCVEGGGKGTSTGGVHSARLQCSFTCCDSLLPGCMRAHIHAGVVAGRRHLACTAHVLLLVLPAMAATAPSRAR